MLTKSVYILHIHIHIYIYGMRFIKQVASWNGWNIAIANLHTFHIDQKKTRSSDQAMIVFRSGPPFAAPA